MFFVKGVGTACLKMFFCEMCWENFPEYFKLVCVCGCVQEGGGGVLKTSFQSLWTACLKTVFQGAVVALLKISSRV